LTFNISIYTTLTIVSSRWPNQRLSNLLALSFKQFAKRLQVLLQLDDSLVFVLQFSLLVLLAFVSELGFQCLHSFVTLFSLPLDFSFQHYRVD